MLKLAALPWVLSLTLIAAWRRGRRLQGKLGWRTHASGPPHDTPRQADLAALFLGRTGEGGNPGGRRAPSAPGAARCRGRRAPPAGSRAGGSIAAAGRSCRAGSHAPPIVVEVEAAAPSRGSRMRQKTALAKLLKGVAVAGHHNIGIQLRSRSDGRDRQDRGNDVFKPRIERRRLLGGLYGDRFVGWLAVLRQRL